MRPAIEAARKTYDGLSADEIQKQVDEARAEDHKLALQVCSQREERWPHWAKKDLWSEKELSALCCGFIPDESGMPSDPGKVGGDDARVLAMERAAADIRRGVMSKALAFVPRSDADLSSRLYGTSRHFVPAIAVEWAEKQFDAFPARLAVAVRERARTNTPSSAPADNMPWAGHRTVRLQRLAAAAAKFWKLYDPADPSTAPTNKAVEDWLIEQGESPRIAQAMATILRADGLPPGPRK